MKIGRAEGRVRAIVDAGGKARWYVEGAAQRDHQMRKVAAYAALLNESIECLGHASLVSIYFHHILQKVTHSGLRPLMTRSRTTTIAITSRT